MYNMNSKYFKTLLFRSPDKLQSPTKESKFTDAVATDKEEKQNWAKMKTKSFKLTQVCIIHIYIFFN